ncbi:MAG: outer membrane beta-barrel protein [Bacteroidota bacterium]
MNKSLIILLFFKLRLHLVLAFYTSVSLSACFLIFNLHSFAQENVITVGIQAKPIFRNKFFNAGNIDITQNNINFLTKPKLGFTAGMIIRKGITKKFSFETGINYVKRNYNLTITDSAFVGDSKFSIIGYEVPLLVLIYIRIGEKLYMNNALGASIDIYKRSDKSSYDYFNLSFKRSNWLLPALLANVGWEYRTEKSGYLYFGASYHLPFTKIASMKIIYDGNNKTETIETKLAGSYLTLDLRYFFHQDPLKK